MEEKFYTQAKVVFQKLSPKEGDTIAVSFPDDISMEQVHSTLTYLQQLADEFSCSVMVLSQGVKVSIFNEEDMAKLGWIRAPEKRTLQ